MSTLSYEAQQRRLRVTGSCGNDDAPRLREAVLSLARRSDTLIVDLTAVTEVTSEVGRALLAAQDTADRCRITLVRKSGSPVDSCLRETQPGISSDLRG
jgi:anti-anti-sigma regulatory factor